MSSNHYGNTEAKIVRKFCREEHLGIEEALVGLVRAMVERHVDTETKKRNGTYRPGYDRAVALVPVMDALHERRYGNTPEAQTYELLFRMLTACSILAEGRIKKATKKDNPPFMRLVE